MTFCNSFVVSFHHFVRTLKGVSTYYPAHLTRVFCIRCTNFNASTLSVCQNEVPQEMCETHPVSLPIAEGVWGFLCESAAAR